MTKFIVAIALVIIGVHLTAFSFNFRDDDSQCWLDVSRYYAIFNQSPKVPLAHCLYSPGIPILASAVTGFGSMSPEYGYLIINLLAYAATGILLFEALKKISSKEIAFITSILFLIDFNTQWYVFSVMPSAVSWLFTALLFFGLVSVYKKPEINFKDVIIWSLVAGYGVVVKTDIAFLTLSFAWILVTKPSTRKIGKLLLAAALITMPIAAFYSVAYISTGKFPWTSMVDGYQVLRPTIQSQISAFIGAYLYSLPLLLIGLIGGLPFKREFRLPLLIFALALLIPILIWPAVLPRFMFNLFPVTLPLAAGGIWWLAKKVPVKPVITVGLVLIWLAYWHMARLYMTLNGLNHLQFIQALM